MLNHMYDAALEWSKYLAGATETLPAQGLVRVMRGSYPRLPRLPRSGKALDVGCGDGRNAGFLGSLGFSTVGLEISDEIVSNLKSRWNDRADFVVGNAAGIPFSDSTFDLLVGWNSIYYMGLSDLQIKDHLLEFRRVLKKEGAAIFSIPQPTSFIYSHFENLSPDSELEGVHYGSVMSDPFGIRVGEKLARFSDVSAVKSAILSCFGDVTVSVGEEEGDWFGLQYDWWVVVVTPILRRAT